MIEHSTRAVVVWAFTDGKAGHENQTRGLLAALARSHPVDARWIHVPAYASILSSLMTRRFLPGGGKTAPAFVPGGTASRSALLPSMDGVMPREGRSPKRPPSMAVAGLPPPDLLIGAGHRTHLPLLAARRAHGGRTVVLMKPSLPRAWFDLCVIPEHDDVQGHTSAAGVESNNVFTTRGALNPVEPGRKNERAGLILIGGPSRHHGWSENDILSQIETVIAGVGDIDWTLTTSRRTPSSTTTRLRALTYKNLTVVPVAETGPGWLSQRLATAAQAWVTEDSVSMVYEALTANAATGVLNVPLKRASRIARGIARLTRDGLVTSFADWQRGQKLSAPAAPFNEAARVAAWIGEKWLSA